MTTKIYGESDDLIELEGHVNGEIGCCNGPVLLRVGDSLRGCYLVWRYAPGHFVAERRIESPRDIAACWTVEIVAINDGDDDGAPLPTITITNDGRSRGPCVNIAEPLPIVQIVEGADVEIR